MIFTSRAIDSGVSLGKPRMYPEITVMPACFHRLAVPEASPGAPEHAGYLDPKRSARPRHHRRAAGLRAAAVRGGGAYDGAHTATRRPVGDPRSGFEAQARPDGPRSEEHTSELQSPC